MIFCLTHTVFTFDCSSAGANLNREWSNLGDYEAPSLERSPEVVAVMNKMEETGVDCFIDIHGDEGNIICPSMR